MKYIGAIVTALVLLSSTPALALGVGADGTITIDANVSDHADATTSADAGSNSDSAHGANAQAQASESASTDSDIHVGPVTLVTRADADAADEASLTVSSPVAVQSETDLSTYVKGLVKADTDMGSAQLSGSAVSLAYTQRAKLFGFIPVLVEATAQVAADGTTTVTYPWYTVFATTDSASLQADIQAATANTVPATSGATAKLSATEQARLLTQIHSAMKSHLQASLAADAQGSASVQ